MGRGRRELLENAAGDGAEAVVFRDRTTVDTKAG
jgi:hypothetical protein